MLRARSWLRLLRVLLACAVLAFAARPAPSAPGWTEIPVLIARAVAPPPAKPAVAARPRPSAHDPRLTRAPRPPAPVPAEAAPRPALDVYLTHCALLC
jgi:hypothetical protein